MDILKLNVFGIHYTPIQSGAYVLVLSEENGKRNLPILIGGFEAQAIALQLEGLKPPRPLTHDLFVNLTETFNIVLVEVFIYKIVEDVFYAQIICKRGKTRKCIDSRASDAIALALKCKCPIFTTKEIMSSKGIEIECE